jgi:hypothetical protein
MLGQWEYMGQVLLRIRIPRKNTLYVGQVLLKNKNTKKVFLASGNMWDR